MTSVFLALSLEISKGQGDPGTGIISLSGALLCFLLKCGPNSLACCWFFSLFFNMPHALLPTGYRIFFLSTVLLYVCKGVLEMTLQKDARLKSFIQQKILKHTIKLAILIFSVLSNILISDFKPCCSL